MRIEAFDVSADEGRLAFVARRPGKEKMELWSRGLEDGRETMIGESGYYFAPRLSRDGALLAFQQASPSQPGGVRIAWTGATGGDEHPLPGGLQTPWDWSPDGTRLLHNCPPPAEFATLCTSPRDASSTAEARPVAADPDHLVWQGRFSPDGRWITFQAQARRKAGVSILGVVPASGGDVDAHHRRHPLGGQAPVGPATAARSTSSRTGRARSSTCGPSGSIPGAAGRPASRSG